MTTQWMTKILCSLGFHDDEPVNIVSRMDLYQSVIKKVEAEIESIYGEKYRLRITAPDLLVPIQEYVCLACRKQTSDVKSIEAIIYKAAWKEANYLLGIRARELKAQEIVRLAKET